MLSTDQLNKYRVDGFLSPLPVLSSVEAGRYRSSLEEFEDAHGLVMKTAFRNKPHLVFTWVNELMRHPNILGAVETILGPNILVWGTNFFIKEPGDETFISWHQDSTYWGLSTPDVVTAWLALSPSNIRSGAMKMIPGSHLIDQLPHKDTFEEKNLLTRGQVVDWSSQPEASQLLELNPGEISLHHVRTVHGSEPNLSADRRIGLAIRYIPTHLRQISGERDYATLVKGEDNFDHFIQEPIPEETMGSDEIEAHKLSASESFKILYRGTGKGVEV